MEKLDASHSLGLKGVNWKTVIVPQACLLTQSTKSSKCWVMKPGSTCKSCKKSWGASFQGSIRGRESPLLPVLFDIPHVRLFSIALLFEMLWINY